MKNKYIKNDYIYSELTGQLIRFAYDIYDELGYGLLEKVYHRAFERVLIDNKIPFKREKYGQIKFRDATIGRYFLDFYVDNKVAVEFKVRNNIYETDATQLLNYIKSENIKVGLLIVFSKTGLKFKRLANCVSEESASEKSK